MGDSLAPEAVEPLLAGRFGRPYLYREGDGESTGLLGPALAEGATAVRDGRIGGRWEAPAGTAILCSVLLRPPPERGPIELPLVGAVATAEAVEAALGLSAQIKWPNDVLVNRQKVAGVFVDALDGAVVLGIALNVNQRRPELPEAPRAPAAASLLTIDTRRRERAPLLADLLLRLEHAYEAWCAGGLDALYVGLGSRDFLRGRRVSVDGEAGIAVAIDRAGRLELDVGGVRRFLETGRVSYVR